MHSMCFTDSLTGYAVGGRNAVDTSVVLKTTDGGINWISQPSPSNYGLRSVYFVNSNIGYAVGSDSVGFEGSIIKTTNGGVLSVRENSFGNSITIAPNPFTSQTTITFSSPLLLQAQQPATLKIMDILGNEILKQVQNDGRSVTIDMSSYAKGVYFVEVVAGEQVWRKKMVKQ